MLSTETRRALSLLQKSINATLVSAVAVDLRTVPMAKREVVKDARVILANLSDEVAALLVEADEAKANHEAA
jgi:hypothetical protein